MPRLYGDIPHLLHNKAKAAREALHSLEKEIEELESAISSPPQSSLRGADLAKARGSLETLERERELANAEFLHAEKKEHLRNATRRLCRAFSWHSDTVHYAQSMHWVAFRLLMIAPEEEAFWLLVAMYEDIFYGPWDGNSGAAVPDRGKEAAKLLLEELIEEIIPEFPLLASKEDFESQMGGDCDAEAPNPNCYPNCHSILILSLTLMVGSAMQKLMNSWGERWFCTGFCGYNLPIEATFRIWDLLLLHGRHMLFSVALSMLILSTKAP